MHANITTASSILTALGMWVLVAIAIQIKSQKVTLSGPVDVSGSSIRVTGYVDTSGSTVSIRDPVQVDGPIEVVGPKKTKPNAPS